MTLISAKIGPNLRKFEKKMGNLVKMWPKSADWYMNGHFFFQSWCMGPISNSTRHDPSKNQT